MYIFFSSEKPLTTFSLHLRVQVFILKYIFFHRFKMSSFLFHWLKQKKMVFGKMDHLKRPIEIEILCLKNEISVLILACVAGRFVMCWAFFFYGMGK